MERTNVTARWSPMGDGAARATLPAGSDPRAVFAALRALPGVRDAVVTERHAAVYFDPGFDLERAHGALEISTRSPIAPPREFTVRVRYDGPDLVSVAAWAGCSIDDVIRLHTARAYTVRVVGFLPGFAYLAEVDPRIAAPRLPSPRPRVPPNAVGIAGARTGIYPLASPGGWNLIGTALDVTLFDPDLGARFALGDRVSFEPA